MSGANRNQFVAGHDWECKVRVYLRCNEEIHLNLNGAISFDKDEFRGRHESS